MLSEIWREGLRRVKLVEIATEEGPNARKAPTEDEREKMVKMEKTRQRCRAFKAI